MLISLAIIFITSLILGKFCESIGIPKLIGLIITGIIIGPNLLNLIDLSILNISDELRKIALIIILLRAGLGLDINKLKKVGRPALLLTFVPACFEILGSFILAPMFFNVTKIEALLIGCVIAAVSPAVVVPRMLKLIDEKRGTNKSIPQMILTGASVDDIVVIIFFTSLINLMTSSNTTFSIINILSQTFSSIVLGITLGVVVGYIISIFFRKFNVQSVYKVLIVLSIAFILTYIETRLTNIISFSSLLSIMVIGVVLLRKNNLIATEISTSLTPVWSVFEIFLFVLVGAKLDMTYVLANGFTPFIFIILCLLFRMIGVFTSLIKTSLTIKEKQFCAIAYLPKATVQAAIGSIPLSLGLPCGELILCVAVISIIISAPVGAIGIDRSYKRLLKIE